jgi:hypothetical protein
MRRSEKSPDLTASPHLHLFQIIPPTEGTIICPS